MWKFGSGSTGVLPIVLNHKTIAVGLAGSGTGWLRRRQFLAEAGVEPVVVAPDESASLDGLRVLYIAGVDQDTARALVSRARAAGILVNVEDVPELCDFHVPATVRRGNLLLTVSTSGHSPGLVRLIREWLAARFGAEWGARVDVVGAARKRWRAEGMAAADVARHTRDLVSERGWLA